MQCPHQVLAAPNCVAVGNESARRHNSAKRIMMNIWTTYKAWSMIYLYPICSRALSTLYPLAVSSTLLILVLVAARSVSAAPVVICMSSSWLRPSTTHWPSLWRSFTDNKHHLKLTESSAWPLWTSSHCFIYFTHYLGCRASRGSHWHRVTGMALLAELLFVVENFVIKYQRTAAEFISTMTDWELVVNVQLSGPGFPWLIGQAWVWGGCQVSGVRLAGILFCLANSEKELNWAGTNTGYITDSLSIFCRWRVQMNSENPKLEPVTRLNPDCKH